MTFVIALLLYGRTLLNALGKCQGYLSAVKKKCHFTVEVALCSIIYSASLGLCIHALSAVLHTANTPTSVVSLPLEGV